jgi:O-antigen ligase
MKFNWNKFCFLILLSISIGITIFLAAISLFTKYIWLQYVSLILVFIQSMYLVKSIHRLQPLYQIK